MRWQTFTVSIGVGPVRTLTDRPAEDPRAFSSSIAGEQDAVIGPQRTKFRRRGVGAGNQVGRLGAQIMAGLDLVG